jgi:hypothetical protein
MLEADASGREEWQYSLTKVNYALARGPKA